MGSVSDTSYLHSVLEAHGDELRHEVFDQLPRFLQDMEPVIALSNEARELRVEAWVGDGCLELRAYPIFELLERFPAT